MRSQTRVSYPGTAPTALERPLAGGFTLIDGALSNLASMNSSMSGAAGVDVALTASRSSTVARVNTNSPVARTFASVSFSARSPGVLQENRITGGAVDTMLKCENGARLTWPSGLWLLLRMRREVLP